MLLAWHLACSFRRVIMRSNTLKHPRPVLPFLISAALACVAGCGDSGDSSGVGAATGGAGASGGSAGAAGASTGGVGGNAGSGGSAGAGASGQCAPPPLGPEAFKAIDQGVLNSEIVIDDAAPKSGGEAALELQLHLKLATGVEVPIVQPPNSGDASKPRFIIGPGTITEGLNLGGPKLEVEAYRVVTKGDDIVFLGADKPGSDVYKSPATRWAVQDFLDRQLGVHWLWPGVAGTHVPKTDTVVVHQVDRTSRPALEARRFRVDYNTAPPELHEWLIRHQISRRKTTYGGHAFIKWWDRFAGNATTKKYFAVAPDGAIKLVNPALPSFSKLNLSNPAVSDQIVADWKAAGKPDQLNVTPNDGSGFCSSDGSREMDKAAPSDPYPYSKDEVWTGDASVSLTRRFVKFWNAVAKQVRAELPAAQQADMQFNTLAYSRYRQPPPSDLPLEPGFSVGLVPSYLDFETWDGWAAAGVKQLGLRPNWWNMGGDAPHLPLHQMGKYIQHAQKNKMGTIDMDYMFGYWGTQGANYYLAGRLLVRPDLCIDQILDEYVAAFGKAAPDVRSYLDYFEQLTIKAAYPFPVGGAESQDPNGLYEALQAQHKFVYHPLRGSWEVIPYLFTDAVFKDAEGILAKATAAVTPNTPEATRVQFLVDSLAHFKMRRTLICRLFPTKHATCDDAGSAACPAKSCAATDTNCLYQAAEDAWNCEKQRMNGLYGPVVNGPAKPGRLNSVPEPGE